MSTVIFYIAILVSSTFFVYISDKGKGSLERNTFLFIAFLITFIPPAIRYDIGTDYFSYISIYNNIEYYNTSGGYKYIEPAYYLINKLLQLVNANVQWVFIISAFIYTYTSFKAYPKEKAWVLHLIIFVMLWLYSMNITRQSISTVFYLLALFKYFERKHWQFIIFSLIGISFHFSALVIAFAALVSQIPLKKSFKLYTAPPILIGIIIFTYISMGILVDYIEQILQLLNLTKYLSYFGGKYFVDTDAGSSLGVFLKIATSIYIIINTKNILKINEQYWVIILLNALYAISTILAQNILIFGRLQLILTLAPIISTLILFNLPGRKQTHKLIALIIISLGLISFLVKILPGANQDEAKLNPYQTILSK